MRERNEEREKREGKEAIKKAYDEGDRERWWDVS